MPNAANIVDANIKLGKRRRFELARLHERAGQLDLAGKLPEALACSRRALQLSINGHHHYPGRDSLIDLATSCRRLACLLVKIDQDEKAIQQFRNCLKLGRQIMERFPGAEHRRLAIKDTIRLAGLLVVRGGLIEAGQLARQAVAQAEGLSAETPCPDHRELLLDACTVAVQIFSHQGVAREAIRFSRRAVRALAVRRGEPLEAGDRYRLAGRLERLGDCLKAGEKPREAAACYRAAVNTYEALAVEHPIDRVLELVADLYRRASELSQKMGDLDKAARFCLFTNSLVAGFVKGAPTEENRDKLYYGWMRMAEIVGLQGHPKMAAKYYGKAFGVAVGMVREKNTLEGLLRVAQVYRHLSEILYNSGNIKAAFQLESKNLVMLKHHAQQDPSQFIRFHLFKSNLILARLSTEQNDLKQALGFLKPGIELIAKIVAEAPTPNFIDAYQSALGQLAAICRRVDDHRGLQQTAARYAQLKAQSARAAAGEGSNDIAEKTVRQEESGDKTPDAAAPAQQPPPPHIPKFAAIYAAIRRSVEKALE